MNASRVRSYGAPCLAALFGTTSIAAILTAGGAYAQAAGPAVAAAPEEVLITGSLIRGASAVGVPVTSLGTEDLRETGEISITDALKSVPSLNIDAQASAAFGGGQLAFEQNVTIHGLVSGSTGVENLLLVNGLRFPPQNYKSDTVNPSIIPQIAIDRIDVLAAGASAVYGSDASAGVINVLLKRNFDGAITQASIGGAPDIGYHAAQFSQLYGKSWDGGNVTVSYEVTDKSAIETSKRSYYTVDFSPWGLMNLVPLKSSIPAVVTVGKAKTTPGAPAGVDSSSGTMFCANCYSVPKGQDGQHLAWTDILANPGVKNEVNPWLHAQSRPALQTNAATLTFNQNLFSDLAGLGSVELFADAFYSNQRGKLVYPPNNGDSRQVLESGAVPTTNPFYPAGAPAGLNVNYSLALEVPTLVTGGEVAGHYDFGFNLDGLPYNWHGKLTYSMTDDQNYGYYTNDINKNNFSAALGNTITDPTGVVAPYTKPANVPYLNVFCDPAAFTCNSPATLQYIVGYDRKYSHFKVQETGANFDGPLFELPGGMVRAALAAQTLSQHALFSTVSNNGTINTAIISDLEDPESETSFAFFGQVDVPLVGENNALPLVRAFNLEAGYRYDNYSNVAKGVYTPKISANWDVGLGLTLRGAWGKSFRVPAFAEAAGLNVNIEGVNALGGAGGASSHGVVVTGCDSVNGSTPGVALPGSLTAILNPTCSSDAALRTPGGILVSGSAGGATVIARNGQTLGPESTQQWDLGFNFAPTDPILGVNLSGLNIDVTMYHIHFENVIANGADYGLGGDDPASFLQFTVIPHPELPITDPSNASFYDLVRNVTAVQSAGNIFDPAFLSNIKYIYDTAIRNIGTREFSGIDFNWRYDLDLGDWGTVNVGAVGNYAVMDKSRATADSAILDTYRGKNSGNRLTHVRYRLGWANETWSTTLFADYLGHGAINTGGNALIPPCFYQPGFSAGSCFAGSQYFGPLTVFNNFSPATVLFDISIGYQSGDTPRNENLRNIAVRLTVNDIFNKTPPFQVGVKGSGTGLRAFDTNYSDLQRTVNLSLTKVW